VAPAVFQHRRARAIDLKTVARLLPLAAVAVLAGVGISELSIFAGAGEVRLRLLFGLFLIGLAGYDLQRLIRPSVVQPAASASASPNASSAPKSESSAARPFSWRLAALVAIPTGLVAGMLGVGGGVMAVPLQRRFLRIPIRNAIANSAAIIMVTSLIGAFGKNYAYLSEHAQSLDSLRLAAVLIPTAILGGLLGGRLTHVLPLKMVKVGFLVVMFVAGARFVLQAV
jgi:uncharacterized membrane protein YfcA